MAPSGADCSMSGKLNQINEGFDGLEMATRISQYEGAFRMQHPCRNIWLSRGRNGLLRLAPRHSLARLQSFRQAICSSFSGANGLIVMLTNKLSE